MIYIFRTWSSISS